MQTIRSLGFKYLEIWDITPEYLSSKLSLPLSSIPTFFSSTRYLNQIHLSSSSSPGQSPQTPFQQRLNIDIDLRPRPEGVLYFGSLFGSKRLVFGGAESEQDREMRKEMGKAMGLGLDVLKTAAGQFRALLDGPEKRGFVGLHVRLEER